jgi:hypothetical protein
MFSDTTIRNDPAVPLCRPRKPAAPRDTKCKCRRATRARQEAKSRGFPKGFRANLKEHVLYYYESIINRALQIHSNHFEVQASCVRRIPTSAMRRSWRREALGAKRAFSYVFISSSKQQMPKSRNLAVDIYSFNPSSRYKRRP